MQGLMNVYRAIVLPFICACHPGHGLKRFFGLIFLFLW
ncbi:hypothetical protein CJA_2126 [Cellvibrio japonicus Ueda107]|uniref:Uncharacterized protein n=1 Tax=Cellvibrio japonicus (strain Ueda107) TaxID=498211 RepID=B3PII6_CELJU|nr:hypothetical protein CJA_2126 [Cellvibrio japonicus Ueda107]